MDETNAFELTGWARQTVEDFAANYGVNVAEALTLILHEVAKTEYSGYFISDDTDAKEVLATMEPKRVVRNIEIIHTDDYDEVRDTVRIVHDEWTKAGRPDNPETVETLERIDRINEFGSDGDEFWELDYPNGDRVIIL